MLDNFSEAPGYSLASERSAFYPDRPSTFRFQVLGPDGRAVTAYRELHERELHLIVVRQDLATFEHLHPTRQPDGTWSVELNLPLPGPYRAFADVAPKGGPDLTLSMDLTAPGDWASRELPRPSRTVRSGEYEVRLTGGLVAGAHAELAFTVSRGDGPVDLQPYLGALGHLVALRAADLAYLHVHPLEGGASGTVRFGVEVSSSGPYRLFLQFLHGGHVHTAAFTVEASAADQMSASEPHSEH